MKAFFRTLAVLLLTVLVGPCIAYADEWPYAKVSCEKDTKQVVIEELSAEEQDRIPKQPGVQDLIALTTLETRNGPSGKQDFRVRKADFWFECDIDHSHYKIKISPWKFSPKIAGMCGGYFPSIQLSVWRASRKLLDKLIFSGFCNPPESDFFIPSVRFLESERAAIVVVDSEKGPAEQRLAYAALASLRREQLHPR